MAELTGKTIADLPEDTSLSGSELFPVMDGSKSKRVQYSTLRSQFLQVSGGTVIGANTDLDTYTTPGTFYVYNLGNVINGAPNTEYAYKLVVMQAFTADNTPRLWQIAYVMNPGCTEFRRNYNANGWGEWQKFDIGSITNKLDNLGGGNVSFSRLSVQGSNLADLDIPASSHGLLFTTSASGNANGFYAVFNSSSLGVVVKNMVEAPLLTLTPGTNKLTIANASEYWAYCLLVTY